MSGVLIMTILALIISIVLVVIDFFPNHEDKSEEYLKLLPGYNCGSCGFGSCKGMSEAMCRDINNYKKCRPLRGENLKKMEEYIKLKN